MKIKKTLSTLFILVIVFGVVSVINSVHGDYTNPPANFPSCDAASVAACNTPLNVGSKLQTRDGELHIDNGLSTQTLYASKDSEFVQDVYLDKLANKGYSTGGYPAYLSAALCADKDGKVVTCKDSNSQTWSDSAYNSNDLVEVTLRLTSQQAGTSSTGSSSWAKWAIESNKVLLSGDPAAVAHPDSLGVYYAPLTAGSCPPSGVGPDSQGEGLMGGTGMYYICLGYEGPGGSGVPQYVGMNKIISMNMISFNGTSTNPSNTIKLVPVSYSGGTAIGFTTSDDDSLNNLQPGDKIVILFLRGGRN
jgi:hypothetical protein